MQKIMNDIRGINDNNKPRLENFKFQELK